MHLLRLRNPRTGVRPLNFASLVVFAPVWGLILSAACHPEQVTPAIASKAAPAASFAPASPAQVPFGAGKLAVIGELGCAVTTAQTVRCWGPNEHGQLGQADLLPRWGGVT